MAICYNGCFLVLVLSLPVYTFGELLCHQFLTAVVKGYEDRDVLRTEKHIFTKNYYEKFNSTHFRVCICSKVPCLRKCCPLGQVFINSTCQNGDLDIKPEVYTENLNKISDYGIGNFHRVYGNTCKHNSFQLEPESYQTDEYYLLVNGSLFLPADNIFYTTSEFCFENVVGSSHIPPNGKSQRAFVCFPEDPVPVEKNIVYPIGMIISMPFLLATFIVYSLPELRNLHGKNLMSHVASLLTAYIVLVITQLGGHILSDTVCVICGFLTQYSFLATFFWLNVMCFDIWSTFSGFGKFSGHVKEKENKKFLLYSLYAWGCPTLILIVTVIMDYAPNIPDSFIKPNIGTTKCYFETKMATLLYFYGPMGIILLCDITLFTLTALKIFKVRKETKVLKGKESKRHDEANKQRYNLYLKLFMVMGINWATELISWVIEGPKELWYVTDIMNSLQGLFMFWIFVCSRKIQRILMSRCCPQWAKRDPEMNTSSLKMSMSSGANATDNVNSAGSRKGAKVSRNGV